MTFFYISKANLFKVQGRNPSTQEVYKKKNNPARSRTRKKSTKVIIKISFDK